MRLFFLLFTNALSFGRELMASDNSRALVRYTSSSTGPYVLAIHCPAMVTPQLLPFRHLRVVELRHSRIFLLFLKGPSSFHLSFWKDLCKIWAYPYNIEEGAVIDTMVFEGGRMVWSDRFVDSLLIPDFTVHYIAFNSFGIVLTLLLKVYCARENVRRNGGQISPRKDERRG
jgi:hypothetical protein